jgi:sterol desaturase/sphingolipid hydroxylase (fatty acid hydroxylase superfamily)
MLLDWVDYYSLLFLAPFVALELFWRARRYEAPRGWRWRAAAVSLAVFGVSLAVVAFYPLLGLTPEAGAIATAFLAFNAAFQHANIRTPRWLGYVVQRPESHGIHHGRGIHRWNYSDLPLWDIVFGTFRNPVHPAPREAGFYRGASSRLARMLAFRDVTPA